MTVTTEAKLRSLGARVETEPFPLKPLGRVGRRRMFVRRFSTAVAAATVLIGLVAGVVVASNLTGDRGETIVPSARLQTHVDERFGWELSYPSNWRLQEIDRCPSEEECELGVVVSNLKAGFRHYGNVFLTDVPRDFVGIGFAYERYASRRGPILPDGIPDTDFPLTLKSLHLAYEWPRSRYWGDVALGGERPFRVDLWIGPEASAEDVRAVEAVLASITKPLHAEPSPIGVGELSTTIDGDEVGVRMEIEPAIVPMGIDPALHFENTGAVDLEYGVQFKLEMRSASGEWRFMNEGQVWNAIAFTFSPGESDDRVRIAMFDASGEIELAPGTYRITKEFGLVGRDEHVTVSALFLVVEASELPEASAGTGRIAFVLGMPVGPGVGGSPTEPAEIYAMDGGGGDVRKIVPNNSLGAYLSPASWSPDGAQLMYSYGASRFGPWDVRVVDADGSNPRSLYSCTQANCPIPGEWSPDGRQVLFVDGLNIGVADADFSNRRLVTNCNPSGSTVGERSPSSCYIIEGSPTWSPDGERIAYARGDFEGKGYLVVMNEDGSDPVTIDLCETDLCIGGIRDSSPSWSPDGTTIAFAKMWNIYLISADGTNEFRLTDCPVEDGYQACGADRPQWSPDGRMILYRTDEGLFTIELEGGEPQRIGPAGAYLGVWSDR